MIQTVFKRYELKYLLSVEQQQRVLEAIEPYMALDRYGRTTIRNLYFDTPDYRLIRRSIEKPVYKEKLRIRSYEQATPDSPVFAELKKKYQHVVYKRRVVLPNEQAMAWLCDGMLPHDPLSQIEREICYFADYYKPLRPTVALSYDRKAYYQRDGGDFRITFDDAVRFRRDGLSLELPAQGMPILDADTVLMELKCSGGIPLWMTDILSREHLYKTSFSKYGTAYQMMLKENKQYA